MMDESMFLYAAAAVLVTIALFLLNKDANTEKQKLEEKISKDKDDKTPNA